MIIYGKKILGTSVVFFFFFFLWRLLVGMLLVLFVEQFNFSECKNNARVRIKLSFLWGFLSKIILHFSVLISQQLFS